MCSLTLNTSQNAVTIVNIQLISKNIIQFNQYLSQKSRFFAENSLFKVFEKILASIVPSAAFGTLFLLAADTDHSPLSDALC